MESLVSLVRKHPELIGVAVVLVALIAWMQSRQAPAASGGDDVTFTGGGVHGAEVDPGVVAIEQSRIEAGSRNLGTLASLLLGRQQSSDALEAAESQTDAALTADLYRTGAARDVGLAGIEAQRTVGLAQTQASVDISAGQNNASIIIAGRQYDAATLAAQLSAQTQAAITAANIRIAELEKERALEEYATERDVARVQAKSDFWGDMFGVVSNIGQVLTFGLL
jgi:hypothetical protein